VLIGYGCGAINPYLVFETIEGMIADGLLTDVDAKTGFKNYAKAVVKGVIKIASKIGISTIQSYRGAQIFRGPGPEPAGHRPVLHLDGISNSGGWPGGAGPGSHSMRHRHAFPDRPQEHVTLDVGGDYQWRKEGEKHLFSPEVIHGLQKAVRTGDYEAYKQYARVVNEQEKQLFRLRDLLQFKQREPIPLDEVEPIEAITRRFKTGAMSYGSISKEAHEALAIAMNRIGGKSNTGEGGEDPERYTWTNEKATPKTAPSSRWPRVGSASPASTCPRPGKSRSRWPREPNRARADSFPVARSIPGLPRCATPPPVWA
jgi:glutamate synthase (ferredoxin)